MYYEEKVIDGKLCWRGLPNGEWFEYTKEQLTRKLQESQQMKTREEIARFMEGQMIGTITAPCQIGGWHYGKCELRQLMDFIFDGPPTNAAEKVFE